jgi:hypothetical protein
MKFESFNVRVNAIFRKSGDQAGVASVVAIVIGVGGADWPLSDAIVWTEPELYQDSAWMYTMRGATYVPPDPPDPPLPPFARAGWGESTLGDDAGPVPSAHAASAAATLAVRTNETMETAFERRPTVCRLFGVAEELEELRNTETSARDELAIVDRPVAGRPALSCARMPRRLSTRVSRVSLRYLIA